MLSSVITATFLASLAVAAPAQLSKKDLHKRQWDDWKTNITIHESCNATEVRRLDKALAETFEVAEVARDYILANGPSDPVYQLYFGKGDWIAAIGAYEGLLSGNKEGVLLRCDNIDGNCGQVGWNGHWRGENGTLETVICDLSYQTRVGLESFCMFGYNVVGFSPSYYFATDLLHRLWHVPTISNSKVSHYADEYEDCLELAEHNSTYAPYNTHTLQYFAADVYARTVVLPGVGCTGTVPGHDHSHDSASSAVASATSAAVSKSATAVAASVTVSAASSCHTHANGDVHC